MLLTLFSRLLLRLLPLCLLLCVVLPALGGRSLAPNEAWKSLGFTVRDLPCFAGLVPGKIAYRSAPDVLARQLPQIGRRMFFNSAILSFWASSKNYELAGWAGYDRGTVGELRLTLPLPFAQLLNQLGTPDCIMTRIPPTERTGVYWIRDDIAVVALLSLNEHNFSVNSLTTGLWLKAFRSDDCAEPEAVRWHGFTTTAEYLP